MKIMAFNGSPRKNRNTATLLEHALKGAGAQGAQTELVHLYDLNFKGCMSCFACKHVKGKYFGRCAMKDDITPILDGLSDLDGIILGSPIYYQAQTGVMRMFMERLLFPLMTYDVENMVVFDKKIHTGLIYTMNISDKTIEDNGLHSALETMVFPMRLAFGHTETLLSTDTEPFADYTKVKINYFDPEQKMARHKEVFPVDCKKAYEMGRRFARDEVVVQ